MRFKGVCQKIWLKMGCRLKNMVFIGGELTAKGVSLCSYHMLMRQVLVHLIKPKIPQATMQAWHFRCRSLTGCYFLLNSLSTWRCFEGHFTLYNQILNQYFLVKSRLMLVFAFRNRKHVSCFYRVIETRVEVWENEKCCGNTSRRRVFPLQLYQVLANFHECLYNSIETRSTRKTT